MRTKPLTRRILAAFLASVPCAVSAQLVPSNPDERTRTDATEPVIELERFVAEETAEDPNRIVPNAPTQSVLGLGKNLYDTPRSATAISSEFIKTLSIRNSEDIARIVPGTYSTFRFGLQGNVSVRNQTTDFYFRGMRRIDPQGNYRTIFAANDSIEIVRGPPSPVYGLGRIGGYLNFNPKTARLAKTGKYLDKPTGYLSYTYGSYEKSILQVDVGGPVNILGKNGGFQVFGYYEDSDSYYSLSPNDRHKIVQATLTLDLNDHWRLETGGVSQYSKGGLPGGVNRTTQQFVDTGQYWNGTFAYNMDTNGNGEISDREIFASYFGGIPQLRGPGNPTTSIGPSAGYLGQTNDPLRRRFPWTGGRVDGGTITVDQFLAGYDVALPAAVGGQTVHREGYQHFINTASGSQAFYMPYAFTPALGTWELVPFDYRRSFGEDYYEAYVYTFFFDLINDTNPDFTYKNQVLIDTQNQEKTGRNPFSQFQDVFQLEDKFTVTKTFSPKWDWLDFTALGSANWVYYDGGRISDTGDYDFRRSLMGDFNPNDTFVAFTKDRTLDGSQPNLDQNSTFYASGLGVLTDTTLFSKVNFLVGGRVDSIDAHAYVGEGLLNRNGNGIISTTTDYAKTNDVGWSYSASANVEVIKGLKPYITYAVQSAIVGDGSTGGIPISNIRRGALGESLLREAGVKGSYFGGKLFFALAAYEQTRNSFDPNDGAGSIGATEGRGVEGEFRWAPNRRFSLSGGFSLSKTVQIVSSGNTDTNTRWLGFPDVVDAAGNVVIPAEAFGWGGRVSVNIPSDVHDYDEVQAPGTVMNLTGIYYLTKDLMVRATGYYQNGFSTDRLKSVSVPSATVFDTGFAYTRGDWELRASVINVFDKLYFSGGSFQSVATRLPRTYEATITRNF